MRGYPDAPDIDPCSHWPDQSTLVNIRRVEDVERIDDEDGATRYPGSGIVFRA